MQFQRHFRSHLGVGIGLLTAGCLGSISEPGVDSSGGGGSGSKPSIGSVKEAVGPSTQARRLTRTEYNNTVRDLLGDTSNPADAFSPDEKSLGIAIGGKVSNLLGEQYQIAAENLAASAVQNLDALLPCSVSTTGEDACAGQFIDDFVPRAFRRPLEAAERARMLALYSSIKSQYDFKTGVEVILRAALQSPHFLYVVEIGDGPADRTPLTQHQIASRMSYFLWSSMPDTELTALANAGSLSSADVLEEQARRMLDDPRAVDTVRSFTRQWLELEYLDSLNKDSDYYPAFDDALGAAMGEETERFMEHVVLQDGSLETLLTANFSFVNADLAQLYGAPPPSSNWAKVTLPNAERSGILTQASFLSTHAHPNQTSPILRGKFVREALLCQIIPSPPANVEIIVPKPQPGATTKERFAQHSSDPACSGCHELMDPIGFAFERYDGIGEIRDLDQGLPIDASGSLVETDVNGDFEGPVELGQILAQSNQVRDCMTRLWFRFALKRGEDHDEYSILQAGKRFADSGYDIKELMVAVTTSHGFRFRRALEVKK